MFLALLALATPAKAAFPGANGKIYTMNADGSNQTRLTNNATNDYEPAWSPDGTKIAFWTYRVLDYRDGVAELEIYTMNADGSNPTRLTNNAALDIAPDWQPIPGPKRSDYKNAAQFCKAEQAFWGDQFASRYGRRADSYGKCVSQNH